MLDTCHATDSVHSACTVVSDEIMRKRIIQSQLDELSKCPLRTLTIGFMALFATYLTIVYVTTPTTPTALLAPMIFLQGFCIAPTLIAAGNIVTSGATLAEVNDISTSYFFLRQLGNTFAVTGATVLFDHRMTLHSSRLLDVANRLDPTVSSTLSQYANLIHRNGGGGSNPSLGRSNFFKTR